MDQLTAHRQQKWACKFSKIVDPSWGCCSETVAEKKTYSFFIHSTSFLRSPANTPAAFPIAILSIITIQGDLHIIINYDVGFNLAFIYLPYNTLSN